MEWAQYGIRVNSVSPGLVKTAMTYWVPQQPDWEQQLKYYGGIPRLAEVEELGGAYVYLLSDAASYTTSIDIPVNGVIGSKFSLTSPSVAVLTLHSLLAVRGQMNSSINVSCRFLFRPFHLEFLCQIHVRRPSGMERMVGDQVRDAFALL